MAAVRRNSGFCLSPIDVSERLAVGIERGDCGSGIKNRQRTRFRALSWASAYENVQLYCGEPARCPLALDRLGEGRKAVRSGSAKDEHAAKSAALNAIDELKMRDRKPASSSVSLPTHSKPMASDCGEEEDRRG